MSKRKKFKLNYQGVGALLKGEEMKKVLEQAGSSRSQGLGKGYQSGVVNAGTRLIWTVSAETKEAQKDNLKNNTLLKTL